LRTLRITHVIVANDDVESDDTQKALYSLAVPEGVELNCLSVEEAAKRWREGRWSKDHVLMLISSPEDAVRLLKAGAPISTINVGGMHFREGRVQVLKAVSLDDHDIVALRALASQGVSLEARPLPLDEPVEMTAHLERWQQEGHHGEQPR
jgi:mannose/fructose/N-acetylgalactosamine-specific phosphotransferase system component IIB